MKSTKKIASIALVFLLVTQIFCVAVAEGGVGFGMKVSAEAGTPLSVAEVEESNADRSGPFEYVVVDGCVSISKCDAEVSGTVEVPGTIDGRLVVTISDCAFEHCIGVTRIVLPDSLVSIGNCAFLGCEKLEEINIPDSVRSIGYDAFAGCSKVVVSNLTTDEEVTVIADDAPTYIETPDQDMAEELSSCDDIATVTVYFNYEAQNASTDGEAEETGYEWESSFSRECIDAVMKGILEFNGAINVAKYSINTADIEQLLLDVQRVYPREYVAAGISSYKYSYYPSSNMVVSLQFIHTSSTIQSEYEERYDTLVELTSDLLSDISGMSDLGKIVAIHDDIILNASYDKTLKHYSAYDLLVNGTGVCQAYTYAFKMYMDILGIPSATVVSDGMNHTWNVVMLDGVWYHLDLTWDDPTPDREGVAQYSHTLLTNEEIKSKEHYGWVPDIETASSAYSDMPRTDSNTQYLYKDRWYFYDEGTGSIRSCDIYGNDVQAFCSPATGGVSVYNGVLYYGNGDDILSCDLTTGEKETVHTLTDSEKSKSDGLLDRVMIDSIFINEDGELSYSYTIWKFSSQSGNTTYYTSGVAAGEKIIVLESPVSLEEFYAILDPLSEDIEAQAQANEARTMIEAYYALTSGQKAAIDSERAAKIEKIKDELASYNDSIKAQGTSGGCTWTVYKDGRMVVEPADGVSGILQNGVFDPSTERTNWGWDDYRSEIYSVTIRPGVAANESAEGMFFGCEKLAGIDLGGFDTSNATDMDNMFYGCVGLSKIDVSAGWKPAEGRTDGTGEYEMLAGVNSFNVVDGALLYQPCEGYVVGSVTVHNGGEDIAVDLNAYPDSYPGFSGSMTATIIFSEEIPASAITLTPGSLDLAAGQTADITAAITPEDATDQIVWTSSDGSVATVKDGTVTAVSAGKAIITAAAGDVSATCAVTVTAVHTDYDVTPNINGGASKLYEPWGLRYFAAYNGADIDKIKDRGIAILKDKYYTDGMTAEQFAAHENAFVYLGSKDELGFEAASTSNPNGRYYATLTEGIYSYDISAYYYVVPFAVMENGETIYGTIKKNSMEKILNTNLNLTSITAEEKAICTCILGLKDSVAAHYAASGVPGASIDMNIPRGDSQSAAGKILAADSAGVTPNVVAGASRLIEPWGLRYFAKYDGLNAADISERGMVILSAANYQSSYASDPDAMRLNANAYVFREKDGTLLQEPSSGRWYGTVTEGISSKDIADVYYVVPFAVMSDGSYVYGTVKQNSMLKIMNTNLGIASIPETEKAVTRDIIALYEAVKAYYEA